MAINLLRVVNQQTIFRSILIDKIDRSQGNFSGYAYVPKQPVYIPYSNPVDTSVKGYVDMVQNDAVMLSANHSTIAGLVKAGKITSTVISSADIQTPTVTTVTHGGGSTTVNGTIFVSLSPDITYVTLTNLAGVSQKIPQASFTSINATQIVIPDGAVSIGTPTTGWTAKVQANSKVSNIGTI